jgi:hypothetical protein
MNIDRHGSNSQLPRPSHWLLSSGIVYRYYDENEQKKDRLYFEYNLDKSRWGVMYSAPCFSVISATKLK